MVHVHQILQKSVKHCRSDSKRKQVGTCFYGSQCSIDMCCEVPEIEITLAYVVCNVQIDWPNLIIEYACLPLQQYTVVQSKRSCLEPSACRFQRSARRLGPAAGSRRSLPVRSRVRTGRRLSLTSISTVHIIMSCRIHRLVVSNF